MGSKKQKDEKSNLLLTWRAFKIRNIRLLFRPPLDLLENNFDFVRDCLEDCWAENPDDRPDFKTIRAKLRPMRKGM